MSAAYEAIGKLIVEYAASEVAIASSVEKFLSKRMTGVEHRQARDIVAALVGSSSMERMKQLAKEMAKRGGMGAEYEESLKNVAVQLGALQKFRNLIAHHGAHPYWYDDRWSIQTSNKYNVSDYSKRHMTRYVIEDIEDAIYDLNTCWMRIQYALHPDLREAHDCLSAEPGRHLRGFKFREASLITEAMPV